MLYLIVAFCTSCLLAFVCAPIFKTRYLENLLYIVVSPLVLVLGLGSIVFFLSSCFGTAEQEHSLYSYPSSAVFSGYGALAFFSLSVLAVPCSHPLSHYFRKSSRSKDVLDSIRCFALNRSALLIITAISLVFLLPYWFSLGFSSSGLVAIFTDPLHHYELREASIKYADRGLLLALYGIGVDLSSLSVTLIGAYIIYQKRGRLPLFFLGTILILASNINGSRAGFLQPVIIFLLAWVISLSQTSLNPLKPIRNRLRSLVKLRLSKKLIFNLLGLSSLFCAILIFGFWISFLSLGRSWSSELATALFDSVFNRLLAAPFYSGLITIFASGELGIPLVRYLGGFPGASLLSGNLEPYFISIGKFYISYFRPDSILTPNLNSSGIFLNVSFFSLVGVLVFIFYILVNIWLARLVCSVFASRYRSNPYFLCLSSSWVLASMSWNIVSSIIYVFPWTWLTLSVVLCVLSFFSRNQFRSRESANLKFVEKEN